MISIFEKLARLKWAGNPLTPGEGWARLCGDKISKKRGHLWRAKVTFERFSRNIEVDIGYL